MLRIPLIRRPCRCGFILFCEPQDLTFQQRFISESLQHPDLELLRSSSVVPAANVDVFPLIPTETKRESDALTITGNFTEAGCGSSIESKTVLAESSQGKYDSVAESARGTPALQSTVVDTRIAVHSTAVRGKEASYPVSESRGMLSESKEDAAIPSSSDIEGTSTAAAVPTVVNIQIDDLESSRSDQASSTVASAPCQSSIAISNLPIVAPLPPTLSESVIKIPKTPSAGRGSKQQSTGSAVEASIAVMAGRGIGRGNSSAAGTPHGRPLAPPSPAALSPATATGDGEEEVSSLPMLMIERKIASLILCFVIRCLLRIFRLVWSRKETRVC